MRLTLPLCRRYPKPYYWGFGYHWLQNKVKDLRIRNWNFIMKTKGKRKVQEAYIKELPPGTVVQDANDFVKNEFANELKLDHPWPFSMKYEEGTKEDPAYRNKRALLFDRKTVILEGTNAALNFSNTILEDNSMPKVVLEKEDLIKINSDFMNIVERRLDWARSDDSSCIALPRVKIFPRINYNEKRDYGLSPVRKEFNTLSTFYDLSDLYTSRYYGFIDRRKIISPKIEITFLRDNELAILDLNSDFITTTYQSSIAHEKSPESLTSSVKFSPISASSLSSSFPIFSQDPSSTVDIPLASIEPVNWQICFNKSRFYNENINQLRIPESSTVHTIYLTTGYNHLKKFVDRFFKARVVMFCYGYAASQARKLYGDQFDYINQINYQQLTKPITVQCVFLNESKTSICFAYYQLNTLNFESKLKNQIWFDGPYDFNLNRELIMKKLINVQLIGSTNNDNKEINNTNNVSSQMINESHLR